jgi:hypothetical protein
MAGIEISIAAVFYDLKCGVCRDFYNSHLLACAAR